MSRALDLIRVGLKPGGKAWWGARCCWWTTDAKDLGEIPDVGLPCCPYCGSPLLMGPAESFIASAEANAAHYGVGGLDTFARSHGVPCQHVRAWGDYARMDGGKAFAGNSEVRFPRRQRDLSEEKSMRCVRCGTAFSEAEVGDSEGCPACGATGVPMHLDDDVTVTVNWHELRILGMWADGWAGLCDEAGADRRRQGGGDRHPLRRLQAQHPDRSPLTLLGEIEQLQETYPEIEATGFRGETLVKKKETN